MSGLAYLLTLAVIFVSRWAAEIVAGSNDVMTNHWHVHLKDDLGVGAAKLVAKRNGFSYVAPVRTIYTYHVHTSVSGCFVDDVCLSVCLHVCLSIVASLFCALIPCFSVFMFISV